MKEVKITTEYIKLGQLLKFVGIIDNGSLAKVFLAENEVIINGERDDRRGRKLYPSDIIEVFNEKYTIVSE